MKTLPAPVALTLKTARFEWAMFALLSMLGGTFALLAASHLRSISPSASCTPLAWGGPILAGDFNSCGEIREFLDFRGAIADRLGVVLQWVPVLFGAVIGSQIVSRDIEMRTSQLVWSLEPTRLRWFGERTALTLAAVVLVAILPAVTGSVLAAARLPGIDVMNSFASYGEFGPLVLVRTVAASAVGIAVGAFTGRILPSVLVSLVLAAGLVLLGPAAATQALPGQVVPAWQSARDPTALVRAGGWMGPAGEVLDQDTARALAPNPSDVVAAHQWVAANFQSVTIVLPGTDAPRAQAIEMAGLGFITLVSIASAYLVVRRRRVS